MLDFVHSGPEFQGWKEGVVQPSSCCYQRCAEGRMKCISPHSIFSHSTDCSCLQDALHSPVEPPDFPLASGKV